MTTGPLWQANFSADCPAVAGHGFQCMICLRAATGHLTASGGPQDGRCVAVCCPRHASEAGWAEVKAKMMDWFVAGQIDPATGGPGPSGAPEVWHGDHWDPMPSNDHHGEPA